MTDSFNKVTVYQFKKGHVLFKNGDPIIGLSIFMIKEGELELKYQINDKKKLVVTIPASGLFGIIETLSGEEYRLTDAKFTKDSIVYLWEKEDFFMDMGMIPEMGLKCIIFLSTFLRTINQKIQDMG